MQAHEVEGESNSTEALIEAWLTKNSSDEITIYQPSGKIIVNCVNALYEIKDAPCQTPKTTLVLHPATASKLRNKLAPSAKASEMVSDGMLKIRYLDDSDDTDTVAERSIITKNSMWIIIPAESKLIQLKDKVSESTRNTVKRSTGDKVDLRTPPLKEIEESLRDTAGEYVTLKLEESFEQATLVRSTSGSPDTETRKAAVIYTLLSAKSEDVKLRNLSVEIVHEMSLVSPEEYERMLSYLGHSGLIEVDEMSREVHPGPEAEDVSSPSEIASVAVRVAA